jgi:hypothetical protein
MEIFLLGFWLGVGSTGLAFSLIQWRRNRAARVEEGFWQAPSELMRFSDVPLGAQVVSYGDLRGVRGGENGDRFLVVERRGDEGWFFTGEEHALIHGDLVSFVDAFSPPAIVLMEATSESEAARERRALA